MENEIFMIEDVENKILVCQDNRICDDLSDLYLGIDSAESYSDEQKMDASMVLEALFAKLAGKQNIIVLEPVGELAYDYATTNRDDAVSAFESGVEKLSEQTGEIINICEKSGIETMFAYANMMKTNNKDGIKTLREATNGVLQNVEIGCFE